MRLFWKSLIDPADGGVGLQRDCKLRGSSASGRGAVRSTFSNVAAAASRGSPLGTDEGRRCHDGYHPDTRAPLCGGHLEFSELNVLADEGRVP